MTYSRLAAKIARNFGFGRLQDPPIQPRLNIGVRDLKMWVDDLGGGDVLRGVTPCQYMPCNP